MFGLGKNQILGIDLGQDSIKVAVVEKDKNRIRVLLKNPVSPERTSKDENPSPENISRIVQEMVNECHKNNSSLRKEVNVSVYGAGAICKYLELPLLKPKELATAVPSQVVKHVPFSMDKLSLSFIQIPQISKQQQRIGIFFIAEQNEALGVSKEILRNTGHTISRLETPVLALVRNYSTWHRDQTDGFVALVHSGFKYTIVIVMRDRYPYFTREFGVAGRDFTYAFQMGSQSTWKEAEEYKLKYDVMSKEVPIEPFLVKWLEEVKKSLEFFTKQFVSEKLAVRKIVLTGGTSGMKNLDKRLSEYVSMPVEYDNWENVKFAGLDRDSQWKKDVFNVAAGLALEN